MFDISVLGVHIICRGEKDRNIERKMFVIRIFSVALFDAAENRFRLSGECFSQTPFMPVVQMEFEPVGHPFNEKGGSGYNTS